MVFKWAASRTSTSISHRLFVPPIYPASSSNRGGSGDLHSGDEWIADLTAAMVAASRRQDEQAAAPEPQSGVQGQGGVSCRERREDAGRVGAAV